ncbi:MAG: insecticidal toxin complex protein [uncultured Thiotrichaceae bacterium]|uniref:Insecticidal toxin complex protein n=1 Tax=uncultured Thiotrichaceae bacterium TaxID=298394 RepID=A0A6S6SVT3_9GAMM|nr:MAG: insecticidal toxin complex protein [uncultured Thiotrichaceae bacterium]
MENIERSNPKTPNLVRAPSINLPKGGGAIKGLGEKFAANPVTGTSSFSIPIATSTGRSGLDPELPISYDSGSGNGIFGFGWSLALPSITRKTDKGLPRYRNAEESDTFILSGAEDLVPVLDVDDNLTSDADYSIKRYRPRIEGLFARIERWTKQSNGDVHWRSISKDNILTIYGLDAGSRIADPADNSRIYSWLISETRDDKGNAIVYQYQQDNDADVDLSVAHEKNRVRSANRYLKRIYYGNRESLLDSHCSRPRFLDPVPDKEKWMFEVVFDYGEHAEQTPLPEPDEGSDWKCRTDAFSSYRSGFEIRTTHLCKRVLMFHHFSHEDNVGDDCLVRSTDFTYTDKQENSGFTFLIEATQKAYKRNSDKSGYDTRSLPPLEFKYTQAVINEEIHSIDQKVMENLPIGLDGRQYQWIDLDGEGLSGILTEQAGGLFYKRNISPRPSSNQQAQGHQTDVQFEALQAVATKPSTAALVSGQQQLLDLDGNGQLDLVDFNEPVQGFYERTPDKDWENFKPFKSLPNIDWQNSNLKFVDITGDGHADILISEDDVFCWYPSKAEAGFGAAETVRKTLDEESGARIVFADSEQAIYLADMSGDGLTDIVRIRNGEVCYWPNLGYGRFGAKVGMDNPPWFDHHDQFNQQRIRVADIDGSGANDILYLGTNGVSIYFNLSGNGWSDATTLSQFPPIDNLSSVQTADLLGNGTACLVWSSPLPAHASQPMRYIDLMSGQKPHLLTRIVNNLGAETHIEYAPSTQFYLDDEAKGQPWITKLPFPVHVVERVITLDNISKNRFVSRYAYHHGYFDGIEREFRGFGMVEQWDTEEYAAFDDHGLLAASNENSNSDMPPVHTKTWFHTGAYVPGDKISLLYMQEYFGAPGSDNALEGFEKTLLPDTILPEIEDKPLSAKEAREACRSLKGAMLRQEVYADDGNKVKAGIPYTVTEQNFTIKCLQRQNENRHAVFFTHEREAISYHHERNTNDPRITHAMTLEVDEFGNVHKSLAIAYGRKGENIPDAKPSADGNPVINGWTQADREKQQQTLITYNENDFTRKVKDTAKSFIDTANDYRTPLPCASRSYEITGLIPENSAAHFSYEELTRDNNGTPFGLLNSLPEINYEVRPTAGQQQKRLIKHTCTLYRKNDLSDLLDRGEIESMALPGESYQLAFTQGLLDQVYKRQRNETAPVETLLTPEIVKEGGYVDFDKSDEQLKEKNWWIPSGKLLYHYDETNTETEVSADDELTAARQHFFLPRRFQDPFGHSAYVDYDDYDLFVTRTTDAVKNQTFAEYDYRVLQSRLMTDPNDNQTAVAFDVLGMVAGNAVMGKAYANPPEGDSLEGFQADLTEDQINDFHADPTADKARQFLGNASSRILYNVKRSKPDSQPAFAITLARETHVSDLKIDPATGQPEPTKVQISFSYSDGFGREIQQKVQAEQGQLPKRDKVTKELVLKDGYPVMEAGNGRSRWVGSGWTIFNNKGKPVRQYEPFFTDRHDFEFEVCIGVSPVLFYDPLGRVIATLHPNHTYEKVLFDPWRQTSWDVNDTVFMHPQTDDPDIAYITAQYFAEHKDWQSWHSLRTVPAKALEKWPDYGKQGNFLPFNAKRRLAEKQAAEKTEKHANTPSAVHFDTLGRPFLTFAHNGYKGEGENKTPILHATRVELDIEGNERAVIDARGNTVMSYAYNMAGPEEDDEGDEEDEEETATNRIYQHSMDAGERWTLNDIAGNPIHNWDARGHHFHNEYDSLRRPIRQFIQGEYEKEAQADGHESDPASVSENKILFEQIIYGEGVGGDKGKTANLRGQIYQHYDSSACTTNVAFDFKGNILEERKQHIDDPTASLTNWLDADLTITLHADIFNRYTKYDALNRMVRQYNWHTDPLGVAVYEPQYNKRGLLQEESLTIQAQKTNEGFTGGQKSTPVSAIVYDAKGQRQSINYGNGTITRYHYDPLTFRLEQLRTTRPGYNPVFPETHSNLKNDKILQQLCYTYDPNGNITEIVDEAYEPVFFQNQKVEPRNRYTYDPLYRLIQAQGRESKTSKPPSQFEDKPIGVTFPVTDETLRNYRQNYSYDAVGNIEKMQHVAAGGRWTRRYQYDDKSNRLLSTLVGNDETKIIHYDYDAHGNMLNLANDGKSINWDYQDMIHGCDLKGGGTAYYSYDAEKQRTRKYIEKQGNTVAERFYIDDIERYRFWKKGAEANGFLEEIETYHVLVDQQRLLMIEDVTKTNNIKLKEGVLFRYQYSNHLGSASLELDEKKNTISYEEYHPYGASAYKFRNEGGDCIRKRYRYTGIERDSETGLNYHGARYYINWLGRWVNTDPDDMDDDVNIYNYVSNNPIIYIDQDGRKKKNSFVQGGKDSLYRYADVLIPMQISNFGFHQFYGHASKYHKYGGTTRQEKRRKLLKWNKKAKISGKGRFLPSPMPEKLGCFSWAMLHIKAAYAEAGKQQKWKKMLSALRQGKTGYTHLAPHTLARELQKDGWKVIYFNPDVQNLKSYDSSIKKIRRIDPLERTWLRKRGIKIDDTILNYAPSGSASPDSTSLLKLKKLSKIDFWWASYNVTLISERNGLRIEKPTSGGHSIAGSGLNVFSFNWTRSPNKNPINKKLITDPAHRHAGFIVVPPGSW